MSAPADPSESSESLESPPEPSDTSASDASAPDESATGASSEATASDAATTPANAASDTTSSEADPRMNNEFVRRLPDADLTLVGVVHDHPASVHRARESIREQNPEVVALEAPPLAVPLYETYASDSRNPPSFGGEMSAAAQAASKCDAEVVGIDAPTADFFAQLAKNCWSAETSLETLRQVASGVTSVTRHALTCRIAAGIAERTSLRVEVDDPIDHDCSHADPPAVQARDERTQARRSQSLLRAFDPPRPVRLRDDTREECMAETLESLRSRGETVAVVGLDHLDSVAEQIE